MSSDSDRHGWVLFWRKYLRLTRSGVGVLRALAICASEEGDEARRGVIEDIQARIEKGASFADAADAHPDVFSLCVRELLRCAERRGAWDDVIPEIADGLAEGTFS